MNVINLSSDDIEWESYKLNFNVDISSKDDERRKQIFLDNLRFINDHNKKGASFTLGLNPTAHLELHEIPRRKFSGYRNYTLKDKTSQQLIVLHRKYDWRDLGAVSRVQHQRFKCGSCYAFASIGAVESISSRHTGFKFQLSKQEIVDCSRSFGNDGCGGGNGAGVFKYVETRGVVWEDYYPYRGKEQKCKRKKRDPAYYISSYKFIPVDDELAIIKALDEHGPITAAINSNTNYFRFYKYGIMDYPFLQNTEPDHAILIVGYNLSSNPYYIIKNSWGKSWGLNGYGRVAVFANNMMGIAEYPIYPIY